MYYRQPRYFKDFQCIGGTCPSSCCMGWRIDWTQEEIDKIKNAPNCPQELRELCDKSFAYNESSKKFSVVLEEKRCPFLTEDNFCKIQREMGAEYLSYTCRVYPRNYVIAEPALYAHCRMSCPEIMKHILNNDKATDLVNIRPRVEKVVSVISTNDEVIKKHPEMKFRYDLFEFFYETISDKRYSVEDSIILCALAAQSLAKLVEQNEIDRIPEAIKTLKAQMHNKSQLNSIENIKPNYHIKLGILGQTLQAVCKLTNNINTTFSLTDNSGRFNIDLYTAGEEVLSAYIKKKPFVMRNIALNLLMELCVPFKNHDFTIFENFMFYAACFALVKLNTIAIAEIQNRADDELSAVFDMERYIIKSVAMISRVLCQNTEVDKLIMEILRGNKMLSPAYLALLVK
ncbi:MAG: flagellin lysine-N-methylase [Oscillospiraceae bacterium]|nr:flagellin lysine-N-methylase [Oscillospiraceae bacterium]